MRPYLKTLDSDLLIRILDEARELLKYTGFELNHEAAIDLLTDHGARYENKRIFLTDDLIDRSLSNTPDNVQLFNQSGINTHQIGGYRVHFAPGSSAIYLLDSRTNQSKPAISSDYIRYARIVEQLPAFAAQSTAFVPSDVPVEVSDSFRLYLSLIYCRKPIVTGTFRPGSFSLMKDLQLIVRGSTDELVRNPLTIFTCCPTAPLKWEYDSVQTLLDCSSSGIPIEFVSTPLVGLVSPVTLVGTLVQHTAENLSGIVIAQTNRGGTPVLYGGAPAFFDIRYETTPIATPETMLLACAYNEIGKHLKLPTQAFVAISDSKALDAQTGLETSMGATLAVLTGINSISGPGLLEYLNSFSIEKLILDNELCLLSLRLIQGIEDCEDIPTTPLINELLNEGHFLISDHTRKHLGSTHYFPDEIIDRMGRNRWQTEGRMTLNQRLRFKGEQLIQQSDPVDPNDPIVIELKRRMVSESSKFGMDRLPDGL